METVMTNNTNKYTINVLINFNVIDFAISM